MRKITVIAVREYQAAVKTKAFIFSLVALPVLWGGAVAVQVFLKDRVDTTEKRIAVLDYTGRLQGAVLAAAELRNAQEIFDGDGAARRQKGPRYAIEIVEPGSDSIDRATFDLSERVRKKEIMAFVVIGPDVLGPGAEPATSQVRYHSNSPTYDDIQKWLSKPINTRIQELRFAEANLDPRLVEQVTRHVPVQNLGLVAVDAQGNLVKAEEVDEDVSILLSMGLMMLMLMVVMVGASPLVHSVLEEKTNRIAEVLLGSVSPFEMMMGKLIGMVGVSLTIGTIYLGAAFIAVRQAGYASFFPAHVIWWFVVFQALAVLMYGSLFIAVGAAVNDVKEAQNLMTPVMLVIMLPMLVWLNVVKEPTSSFALFTSLFPPATPLLMILRQAVPPGIPFWQPLLGVVLVLLTTVLFVFAAGRVFRIGILLQGKPPKLTELARWVARG